MRTHQNIIAKENDGDDLLTLTLIHILLNIVPNYDYILAFSWFSLVY